MNTTQNPQKATTITAEPGTPYLEIAREFDASRELVFRAYTDPELVVQWLGPRRLTMTIDEWDARPGGGYRYTHAEEGLSASFRGVFHTVTPEKIIQTFEFDGAPDDVCLESVSFEDLGGRTRVAGRSVFGSVESRDAAVASGMEHGMRESYERLDELLAR